MQEGSIMWVDKRWPFGVEMPAVSLLYSPGLTYLNIATQQFHMKVRERNLKLCLNLMTDNMLHAMREEKTGRLGFHSLDILSPGKGTKVFQILQS